jgi:protease I
MLITERSFNKHYIIAMNSKIIKQKAVMLTADQFEDMEVMYPLMRLQEAGWRVDIAAPKIEDIRGFGYGQLMPNITFEKVNPDNYDLLLIPDGELSSVRKIKKVRGITQLFFAKNKAVACVCYGPWTLADSDFVSGKK